MISPRGDEVFAAIFVWEGVRVEVDDFARRLADAADHWQRVGEFAVPRDERMNAGAAVLVLVAVVAARHDVQQAAGRAGAGIVLHREDVAELIDTHTERIPKTARNLLELFAVTRAAENAAADPLGPDDAVAVAVDHRVRVAQIFAKAEVQMSKPVGRQPAQAVVWVRAGGLQVDESLGDVRLRVAIGVAQAADPASLGDVEPAVRRPQQIHPHVEAVGEDRALSRPAISARLGEHIHTVALAAGVAIRREMRVALDDVHAALAIDGHPSRMLNLWRGYKEFDDKPIVCRLRHIRGRRSQRQGEQ